MFVHTNSKRFETKIPTIHDIGQNLPVSSKTAEIEHDRLRLAGDIGAEDPRARALEQAILAQVLAQLCPFLFGFREGFDHGACFVDGDGGSFDNDGMSM